MTLNESVYENKLSGAAHSPVKGLADFDIYEFICPEKFSPPSVSYFYALPAMGLGTADAESLCSYIARLANAHCVTVVDLIKSAQQNFGTQQPKWGYALNRQAIGPESVRSLNSVGETAAYFAGLFGAGTGQNNLIDASFARWSGLLSKKNLLKKMKAWCVACFAEAVEQNQIIYEKLLWQVEGSIICRRHCQGEPLRQKCPFCRREQFHLNSNSRPGFCNSCYRFLGSPSAYQPAKPAAAAVDFAFTEREQWVAEECGKIIAASNCVRPQWHTKSNFARNLSVLVQTECGGNINEFSHRMGFPHISMRRFLHAEVAPALENLMRICYKLKISPVEILLQAAPSTDFSPKIVESGGHNQKIESGEQNATAQISTARKPAGEASLRQALVAALTAQPPIPAKNIAQQFGLQSKFLRRSFPELYNAVVERYRASRSIPIKDEEAAEILRRAAREEPPPPLQQIFKRMGARNSGGRFYAKFPELCREIGGRYKNHRNKIKDEQFIRVALENALTAQPPVALRTLCAQLNVRRNTIVDKFGELARQIADRYVEHYQQWRQENLQTIQTEVDRAVRELISAGLKVTEAQVAQRLSKKYGSTSFKAALRSAKQRLMGL